MEDKEFAKIMEKAKSDKKIIAVALFGSSLKRKGRDVDICFFTDEITKKEAMKKRIDFSGRFNEKFDINLFQLLPVYIRIRIIKEGKIIFSKNDEKLHQIAFDTIKEFGSYKKLYDMYLENVKNGQRKNPVKV
jgi:hypothetical protein